MSHSAQHPPAGWYPDPAGSGDERYWDGGSWSHVTRPAGGLQTDKQEDPDFVKRMYELRDKLARGEVLVLAGWWRRVFAAVLDYIIFYIPAVMIAMRNPAMVEFENWWLDTLLAASNGMVTGPPVPEGVLNFLTTFAVIMAAVWFIYRVLMVKFLGGTVGQLALRMRVTSDGDINAGRVGWVPALSRALVAVLLWNVPMVGWLLYALPPAFTAKKQAIHDRLASTVVVMKP